MKLWQNPVDENPVDVKRRQLVSINRLVDCQFTQNFANISN
jgi:hypothetical protein